MVVVDEELSQTISQLTNSLFSCIGAVGAIAGATKGTFLVLCVPLIFLYERIQRYFRKSNTAIARNQSVSLSPIYADFSQALTGQLIFFMLFSEPRLFLCTTKSEYNVSFKVWGPHTKKESFYSALVTHHLAIIKHIWLLDVADKRLDQIQLLSSF